MENDNEVIEKRKNKLLGNFKSWQSIALIIVILFSLILGIYYFSITKDQALWYDEGTYMSKAKELAFGVPAYGFHAGRALVDSLIYSVLYKIGFTETFFRFIKILMSVGIIFMVYYLGKEIFSREVGLFAAFAMSFNWVFWYVSTRLFPDVTGFFLWMVLILLFYKGVVSEKPNARLLWFVGPVFVIALFAREFNIFFIPLVGLYFLLSEKLNFLKNKNLWISLGLMILMFLPFFYFYQQQFGSPFAYFEARTKSLTGIASEKAAGIASDVGLQHNGWNFVLYSYDYMGWILIILFLIGLGIFSRLILGFDLYLKGKEKSQNKNLFLLLWIIVPLILYIFMIQMYDERYLLQIYPALFCVAGFGVMTLYNNIKKYNKIIGIIIIICILIAVPFYSLVKSWGGGPYSSQWERGNSLIKGKIDSYWQVRDAGLWLKENTEKDAIVLTNNEPPQMAYYSERRVFAMWSTIDEFKTTFKNTSTLVNLKDSHIYTNQTIFRTTLSDLRTGYIFVFGEPNPAWIYEELQKYPEYIKPVAAWPIQKGTQLQQGNVAAILYGFDFSNYKETTQTKSIQSNQTSSKNNTVTSKNNSTN